MSAIDATLLRARLGSAAGSDGVWAEECRVRLEGDGIRHLLCRGRTYRGPDGEPTRTTGVVIDITESSAEEVDPFSGGESAALDRAAEHGVAIYKALQTSGVTHLLAPARLLLSGIGREIARVLRKGHGRLH